MKNNSSIAYSYDEFTNPDSPTYGDAGKAVYGGMNSFLWSAGSLEGAQYGWPVGAVAGTANTVIKGVDITAPKINWDTPFVKVKLDSIKFYVGLSGTAEQRDKNMRKWLNEQYEKYDQRKADMKAGNVEKIKEDLFGKQEGRPDVNDFNNGLPRW